VNERTENIGARRLYTVMEKLLEDISYDAGTLPANTSSMPVRHGPPRCAGRTRRPARYVCNPALLVFQFLFRHTQSIP